MTTSTATTTTQTQATRGRPLSDRARRTKRAVERFLERNSDTFTAADVRKFSKQSKVAVRNRLNALESAGLIKKVDQVSSGKRGRPMVVYQKSEAPKEREAVRQNRQFVRNMASKTFEERCAYVADALTRLYEEQLADEKSTRDSHHLNGRGFTKYDAPRGTLDAENILESEVVTVDQVNYWLMPVNKDGRSRIQKYARQLQALRNSEEA
jgi:predicted ArsR family transcriptional regulator